jgi:hypothetical protein
MDIDLIKTWSEIAVIASVIAAILIFVINFREQRKISQLNFFAQYTKRYQKIILHLPGDLDNVTILDDEQNKRYLRVYFDLCSEEYFLKTAKHIPPEVWEEWKEGMRAVFRKKAISTYWQEMEKSSYKNFNEFVKEELTCKVDKISKCKKMKNKMIKQFKNSSLLAKFSCIMIITGILVALIFPVLYLTGCVNSCDMGQFGNFIGGVAGTAFALAGTLFVYMTFKDQSNTNKRNRIWEIISIIERRTKDFSLKVGDIDIKGLEKIVQMKGKELDDKTFSNAYYEISGITELCFCAHETNNNSFFSSEEKKSFKRMIWLYSKNVALFWGFCNEGHISISHSDNEQTMLDIRKKEIEGYVDKLKKYLKDDITNE